MFVASVVNPVFNRLLLFESDLDLLHISEWIIVFTYNKEDCFSSVKLCINKKKNQQPWNVLQKCDKSEWEFPMDLLNLSEGSARWRCHAVQVLKINSLLCSNIIYLVIVVCLYAPVRGFSFPTDPRLSLLMPGGEETIGTS